MAHVLDVGVIGSINRDTIERPGAPRRERLGGLLFTACALAHLGRGRLRVRPFAGVARDLLPDLAGAVAAPDNLCLDGLRPIPGPGFRCHIVYDESGAKTETLLGDVPPVGWADLAPALGQLSGLVVNFITGFDIERATLERVREAYAGPVLMDVHSLTLARCEDGRRQPRRPTDWTAWVALSDVVQMNAAEAALLGDLDAADASAVADFAVELLSQGPKAAVITRAAAGAVGAWRPPAGPVRRLQHPATPLDEADIDPTGCGDVFLAALSAAWLLGADLERAVTVAVDAATCNCSLDGVADLARLPTLPGPHGAGPQRRGS